MNEAVRAAAAALPRARALVVAAGAGMGVDSGLPDFRGDEGFWNAYPMYRRLGIDFVAAADPLHFARDPAFGWGFYGHRERLYRDTEPHRGFAILLAWAERFGLDLFVVTSNVDGQFQKAGVPEERVLEVHGSIRHRQCSGPCGREIWMSDGPVPVDESTMRAERVPECLICDRPARPNILMFGDWGWIPDRTAAQEGRFDRFLARHRDAPLVIVELGAGIHVPTIRRLAEGLARKPSATFVRINPREAGGPAGTLSLPCGALAGLAAIDQALG